MPELHRFVTVDFRRGMETTREENTDDLFSWRELLNARVDKAALRRRWGMVPLKKVDNTGAIITFDGSNDSVGIAADARVNAFSAIPEWTIEGLVQPTSYAASRPIFVRNTGTAANVDVNVYMDSTSSGRIVAEVQDDAAAITTLQVTGIAAGTLVDWRLTKASTGVYTLTANGTAASGTLGSGTLKANTSDPLAIGRTNGAARFLGPMEFVRGFTGVRQRFYDTRSRLLDPRAPDVLFDYICEIDAVGVNDYCLDRSRYGLHGSVAGSPATTSSIAHNHAPIRGIASNVDKQGNRRLYYAAGAVVQSVLL